MYGIPESLIKHDMACAQADDEPFTPVSLKTPYGSVSGHPQAIKYLESLMNEDIDTALDITLANSNFG